MTARTRPLVGVALDAAGETLLDPGALVDLALTAERGVVDFVTLGDGFDPTGGEQPRPALDAHLALSCVAAATEWIGLVPTVTTTHTEPFHVSKNIASLDLVSGGRAGWAVAVSVTATAAALFGRKGAAPLDELWAEAEDVIEVCARLWDSWEDDAVIRDRPTGRYLDRDKVHYVDFEGRFFSVRGPSITPRPPQGQPVVLIDAGDPPALPVAARRADLVVTGGAAGPDRGAIRAAVAAAGRDPDSVAVIRRIPVPGGRSSDELAAELRTTFSAGDADGFLLVPDTLPDALELIVDSLLPRLRADGSMGDRDEERTLRERLGLPRPANRYARAEAVR